MTVTTDLLTVNFQKDGASKDTFILHLVLHNNNNNNNNFPVVMKYRVGVRRGITNRLMARWGSSALAGSLSSDGVTIKILVMI